MLRAAWARGMGGFASSEWGRPELRNESRLKPAGLGWQTKTGVKPDAGKVCSSACRETVGGIY